jgi:hypothetical protein
MNKVVEFFKFSVIGMLAIAVVSGCYYSPQTKRYKADESYLSEAEAEKLVNLRLEKYGIKFICNMKLKRQDVMFVADGYDRDMRIGFEYRSHEGLDFEGEEDQIAEGLSSAEIEVLKSRQDVYREYFLVIPEGDRASVEDAIDRFVRTLYHAEVLKKKKKTKGKDALFPEKDKKRKDAFPWETTGDLKKKRQQMEDNEKRRERSPESEDLDDSDDSFEAEPSDKEPEPDTDDFGEKKDDRDKEIESEWGESADDDF